jgi:hypothetical protein
VESVKSILDGLLPDDAYDDLISRVVTEIGSFKQLLGMLQKIKSYGKNTTFSQTALNSLATADVGGADIDKMDHEISLIPNINVGLGL